jgi:predicted amidophosphoribosyltransferase
MTTSRAFVDEEILDGERARISRWRNRQRQRPVRALATLLRAFLPARCGACDAPDTDALGLCGPCRSRASRAPRPAPAVAPWSYAGPIAETIRGAKFGRDPARLRALAAQGPVPPAPEADAVTFVPAHWRRVSSRGFDPAALIARVWARAWGLPIVAALRCARLDPPLSRAADAPRRAKLVAGRFVALAPARGMRLALVDDVVTTGATLREAERALEEGGARAVTRYALAATPRWRAPPARCPPSRADR